MKQKLVTVLVVALALTAITIINKNEPTRKAEAKFIQEQKDSLDIKKAEALKKAEAEAEQDRIIKANMELAKGEGADVAEATPPLAPGEHLKVAPEGGENDYTLVLDCSNGRIVIEVKSEWAPIGAAHLRKIVEAGVYKEARFFRVVPEFMVQFGLAGDPKLSLEWGRQTIQDDPVKMSNTRGMVTFAATQSPNSRSTQIFINYGNNSFLDKTGFAPFGQVIQGMEVADAIYSQYGEKPKQNIIKSQGNDYLIIDFPRLDYVKKAFVVEPGQAIPAPEGKKAAPTDEKV